MNKDGVKVGVNFCLFLIVFQAFCFLFFKSVVAGFSQLMLTFDHLAFDTWWLSLIMVLRSSKHLKHGARYV